MSTEVTAFDMIGNLRNAMESLDEAQLSGEAVPAALDQLSAAIDVVTDAWNAPALLDADQVAEHNALVEEVNAAVDRHNALVEALNATGAWCQICGTVIVDGADAVPTAQIPEENIQFYAHGDCYARLMAAQGEASS